MIEAVFTTSPKDVLKCAYAEKAALREEIERLRRLLAEQPRTPFLVRLWRFVAGR